MVTNNPQRRCKNDIVSCLYFFGIYYCHQLHKYQMVYPSCRNCIYLNVPCVVLRSLCLRNNHCSNTHIGNVSHRYKNKPQINKEPTERSALFDYTIGGTEYRRQGVLFYKLPPSQESLLVLIRKEDTPLGCPLVFILLRIHYTTVFGTFLLKKFSNS